jgi:hypothetical protein
MALCIGITGAKMGQVSVWEDTNAPSTFLSLKKQLNSHLLISTHKSQAWRLEIRLYRKRTDIKPQTAFDAIPEMEEVSLDLAELMRPIGTDGLMGEVLLALMQEEGQKVVFASHDGHGLVLEDTDLETVEQIFVPQKGADYKARQTIKLEGLQVNGIRIATIVVASRPSALLMHALGGVDASELIPEHAITVTCSDASPTNAQYLDALHKARII